MGRSPIRQPPRSGMNASPRRCSSGPQNRIGMRLEPAWASMSATCALSTLVGSRTSSPSSGPPLTWTPCSSSRPDTIRTSAISGTPRSRLTPSPSSEATIALDTRFLAPRTATSPCSGFPPWTVSTSFIAPAWQTNGPTPVTRCRPVGRVVLCGCSVLPPGSSGLLGRASARGPLGRGLLGRRGALARGLRGGPGRGLGRGPAGALGRRLGCRRAGARRGGLGGGGLGGRLAGRLGGGLLGGVARRGSARLRGGLLGARLAGGRLLRGRLLRRCLLGRRLLRRAPRGGGGVGRRGLATAAGRGGGSVCGGGLLGGRPGAAGGGGLGRPRRAPGRGTGGARSRPGHRGRRGGGAGGHGRGEGAQRLGVGGDLLERRTGAEPRHRGFLDLDGLTRARVAAGAGGAGRLLEGAEPGDGDLLALGDRDGDGVDDGLERLGGGPLAAEP